MSIISFPIFIGYIIKYERLILSINDWSVHLLIPMPHSTKIRIEIRTRRKKCNSQKKLAFW